MKDCFVPTENYQALKKVCRACLENAHGIEMVAVIAPAGFGKTTAAEKIAVETPNALFIRTDDKWSPVGLVRQIAFRVTGKDHHNLQTSQDSLANALASQRTMLIMDEADRMNLRHLNTMRDLHDLYSIPIVLVGEEGLQRRLQKEKRIISRVRELILFGPAGQNDISYFYRYALDQKLSSEQTASLASHANGDFRQVVDDALDIEKLMKANSLKHVNDQIISEQCKKKVFRGDKTLPKRGDHIGG